jgi:hypothetical protein
VPAQRLARADQRARVDPAGADFLIDGRRVRAGENGVTTVRAAAQHARAMQDPQRGIEPCRHNHRPALSRPTCRVGDE